MSTTILKGERQYSNECFALSELVSLRTQQGNGRRGFLLGIETKGEYDRLFSSGESFIALSEKKVIGFIVGVTNQNPLFYETFTADRLLKFSQTSSILETEDVFYIDKMVVQDQSKGRDRDLPKKLFEALLSEFEGYYLCCMIVESPVNNVPSKRLAERLGFKKMETFEVPNFKGYKQYRSALYLRET